MAKKKEEKKVVKKETKKAKAIRKAELIEKKNKLEGRIEKLNTSLNKVAQKLAEVNCPFEIGQTIIHESGKKAIVEEVRADFYSDDSYRLFICKLKKDGSRYVKISEANPRFENWTAFKEEK